MPPIWREGQEFPDVQSLADWLAASWRGGCGIRGLTNARVQQELALLERSRMATAR